ncbi:hypothetical protein JHK87_006436 [Glycine soja]|nr:hypothetical protein JHK87_006436 [Glycine soja]
MDDNSCLCESLGYDWLKIFSIESIEGMSVVKPLLQERTRRKIQVLQGCGKEELLKQQAIIVESISPIKQGSFYVDIPKPDLDDAKIAKP